MLLAATIFHQSESARFTEVLTFGRGAPVSAAWRPDGETILVNTAADVWLYTAALTDKAHLPNLRRAAFAGGGRYITGYDPDNQFTLYDATTLTPVLLNPEVNFTWFSKDNQYFAGHDQDKKVWVWSIDDLSTPLELPAEFSASAKGLFWSSVANQIAIHTLDGRLIFWTIGASEVDQIIDIPADSGISWSPDGTKLLVSDVSNNLTMYSVESGEILLTIPAVCDPTSNAEVEYTCSGNWLIWRPDSQQVMVSVGYRSGGYQTVFFDAISGEKQLEVGHEDPYHMIYSQDSQRVIINSSLLDTTSFETLVRLNQGFYQVSPDGLTLAASFYFDGNITLFDLRTGEVKTRFENFPVNGTHQFFWQTPVWSPDSQKLLIINHFAGVLTVHDVNTQQQSGHNDAHLKLRLINFSDDGRYLTGGDYFGGVYLWDLQTPAKPPLYLPAHDNELSHLIWQPGGKLFATTTGRFPVGFRPDDGDVIRIWDGETGEQIALIRHPLSVTSIAWSLDGQYLASVSGGGAFILWNTQEKKIEYRSTGDTVCLVLPRISTTPDPNILKINCNESSHSPASILLWDIRTHERLTHFTPTIQTVWDGEDLRLRGSWLDCRNLLKLCNFKLFYLFGAGIPTIAGHELYNGEISTQFAMPGAQTQNWSPDGEQILITTTYNQAQVWAADTMTLTSTFPLSANEPLIWSPDSTRILLRNEDSSTIMDASTGETLLDLPGLINPNWQANGSYLAGSYEEIRWLVDAQTGEHILNLPDGGLIWNTDETVFAIAGDQLAVWCETGNC